MITLIARQIVLASALHAGLEVLGPHDGPIRYLWVNAWDRARIGRS